MPSPRIISPSARAIAMIHDLLITGHATGLCWRRNFVDPDAVALPVPPPGSFRWGSVSRLLLSLDAGGVPASTRTHELGRRTRLGGFLVAVRSRVSDPTTRTGLAAIILLAEHGQNDSIDHVAHFMDELLHDFRDFVGPVSVDGFLATVGPVVLQPLQSAHPVSDEVLRSLIIADQWITAAAHQPNHDAEWHLPAAGAPPYEEWTR